MLNLRCTQKLLQRLKAEPEQDNETSSTKLGDWYANLLYTKAEQLILFMSEKTLLPVLVPAKPIDTLLPRFRAALREMLTSLKVPEEAILQEESAMVQVRIKKTINRSVLGTMNDFARLLEGYAEDKKFSLLELSLVLAGTPCGAIQMGFPDRATIQLFGGEMPKKTPGENLIYLDTGSSQKRDIQTKCWLGGRFTAPFYVEEIGAHPEIILWVEQVSGRILSFELLPPKAPASAIALTLKSTLLKQKDLAPSHIKVETEEQAALLRRAFDSSMVVEVGPLPELEPIKASLFSRFGDTKDEPPSYLLPKTTPEAMGRLFRAASGLYQAAPWKYMSDGVSPSLSVPALGLSGAAFSVMGKGKQTFGFMLFSSAQDAMLFRDFAEQAQGTREGTPGVEWITLEFVAGAELPPPMRKEIAHHRWEVAGPKAYPEIRWLDKELKSKPYTDKELALLTAAAEGLAIFATKNKTSLSKEELFTAKGRGKSQELPGNPELEIVWPHPQLSPPASAIESGELPSEVGELIKAFLLSQPKDKEWRWLCEGMIEELYRFSLFYMGVALHGFRASIIEEFLLSFLPRKVSLPKESHAKVPRVLSAFIGWLEKQGKLHPYLSRSIQEKIKEIAEESAEASQSEGNFGLAKSIAALAMKNGVDFSNPKEVERFLNDCNAGKVDGFSDIFESLLGGWAQSPKKAKAKPPTRPKKRK